MCRYPSYDWLFDSSGHHRTNSVDEARFSRQTGTSQKKPELGDVWRCHGYNFLTQLDKELFIIIKKIILRKSIYHTIIAPYNNLQKDSINKMFFWSCLNVEKNKHFITSVENLCVRLQPNMLEQRLRNEDENYVCLHVQ